MNFFLNLIYNNTESAFSKALINLLTFRKSPSVDYDRLKKIIGMFNDPDFTDIHIEALLDGVFKKNHSLFRGQIEFNRKNSKINETNLKIKRFILEQISKEENRLKIISSAESIDDLIRLEKVTHIINSWFAWNSI